MQFQQAPGEAEQFQDNADFAQELFNKLAVYAVIGADPDRVDFGALALEVVDDVRFNVNVTIVDPAMVPVPTGHVPPATGEAAAEIVLSRALFTLGTTARPRRSTPPPSRQSPIRPRRWETDRAPGQQGTPPAPIHVAV